MTYLYAQDVGEHASISNVRDTQRGWLLADARCDGLQRSFAARRCLWHDAWLV